MNLLCVQYVAIMCLCVYFRNSQRIVHIPFFEPDKITSPSELIKSEALLREVRSVSSGAIGLIIRIGSELTSDNARQALSDVVLPFVCEHLTNSHFRVQKCYALMLSAAYRVRKLFSNLRDSPDIIAGYYISLS